MMINYQGIILKAQTAGLSAAELGELLYGLCAYGTAGTRPVFSTPLMGLVFLMIDEVEGTETRRAALSEKRRQAVQARWDKNETMQMQILHRSTVLLTTTVL
jgi:hypothetical protein